MQTPSKSSLQRLQVGLNERSYPILISPGLLSDFTQSLVEAGVELPQQIAIITNAQVSALYLPTIRRSLDDNQGDDKTVLVHSIGEGETAKSLTSYSEVMDALIAASFNRDCMVIALGGGVVGDLAGFVAATYQRGVRFLQIPTTLLAQVDSSVGGKTAVNHPSGKNLIGAFYQPEAVIIDPNVLASLSDRDYACGLAEVVKYGVMYDAKFFAWLESNARALQHRQMAAVQYAIKRSCEIKAEVVAADEREASVRALLNLGHTFGHAIETEYHATWRHGEAVAAGMVIAATYMAQQGELAEADVARLRRLLKLFELPVRPPQMQEALWHTHMHRDKKVQAGQLRLVLPTQIGAACVRKVTDWQGVYQAIQVATQYHAD